MYLFLSVLFYYPLLLRLFDNIRQQRIFFALEYNKGIKESREGDEVSLCAAVRRVTLEGEAFPVGLALPLSPGSGGVLLRGNCCAVSIR